RASSFLREFGPEDRIRALQQWLTTTRPGEDVPEALSGAHRRAQEILRAADALVRLAGGEESDAVRTARAAARNALGRIQGLINAVRDQIEQEEGFQREQPTRRAEKAYPFREHNSTLARSWRERRTADDSPILSDGVTAILRSAIQGTRAEGWLAKVMARPVVTGPTVTLDTDHQVWRDAVRQATDSAELVGVVPAQPEEQLPIPLALLRRADGVYMLVDADRLWLINKLVPWDEIRVQPGEDGRTRPVVFVRGGEPVALLMPVRGSANTESLIDIQRALEVVAEKEAAARAKRGGRGRGGRVEEAAAEYRPRLRQRWFSRLERAIETAPQERATGRQWLAAIQKAPGGTSAVEREWTGIDEWLRARADQVLTRQEVLEAARRFRIEVDEVSFGGPVPGEEERARAAERADRLRAQWDQVRDQLNAAVGAVYERAQEIGLSAYDMAPYFSQRWESAEHAVVALGLPNHDRLLAAIRTEMQLRAESEELQALEAAARREAEDPVHATYSALASTLEEVDRGRTPHIWSALIDPQVSHDEFIERVRDVVSHPMARDQEYLDRLRAARVAFFDARAHAPRPTKWADYTEPGGFAYQEIVLTLALP